MPGADFGRFDQVWSKNEWRKWDVCRFWVLCGPLERDPEGFGVLRGQIRGISVRFDNLGCRESNLVDLIKFAAQITTGNSLRAVRGCPGQKRPQPERVAHPAVNFDQDLGRGPNFGVPGVEFGRFEEDWVKNYSRK